VQTYLERDVRAVTAIRDLASFRRFLGLVVARVGQVLNKTDLSAPLGVSVPTVTEWLSVLEVTGQILLVSPYFENFGKRIVKSPKLYLVDSGLACHLLGIETDAELGRSPFLGALFEGFVAAEIVKQQINLGRRRELYYFRDREGLEVDFVVPLAERRLAFIEAKATSTPKPELAQSLSRLLSAKHGHEVAGYLVHRPARHAPDLTVLRPGIEALGLEALLARLAPPPRRVRRRAGK
jgi:predicted AAA+ superfamily ATPase